MYGTTSRDAMFTETHTNILSMSVSSMKNHNKNNVRFGHYKGKSLRLT